MPGYGCFFPRASPQHRQWRGVGLFDVRLRRSKLQLYVSVQVSLTSRVTGLTYTKDRLGPAALFQACSIQDSVQRTKSAQTLG